MSKKLNVVLSERDYKMLEELAASKDRTVSDVVRRALKVGVWYQKEVESTDLQLQTTSSAGTVQNVQFV